VVSRMHVFGTFPLGRSAPLLVFSPPKGEERSKATGSRR
jgi:hypothetical protein